MALLTEHPLGWADARHVVFADSAPSRRAPLNFGGSTAAIQSTGPSLSPQQRSFVHWLFREAGLNAELYREETLARRLPACLRAVRASCVGGARNVIQNDPFLLDRAVSALVIGVTSFFRDAQVFDELRGRILPQLISSSNTLRIWSAGCSDGQELYSVAMLLDEIGWLNRADLLGTDCRPDALRRAAQGVYSDDEVSAIPGELSGAHLLRGDAGWQIRSRLRTVIRWRSADLTHVIEPGTWDLILCRNMVMYLEPVVAHEVWINLARALRPGGFLVVGKAERPGSDQLAPVTRCVFARKSGMSGYPC
jgi:chemotaxis methyl-accepting protein methylase